MTTIRALRRSCGLTLIDLAIRTDIPARTLAEIEYGIQRLDFESRSRLARFFETPPDQLHGGRPWNTWRSATAATAGSSTWLIQHASPALVAALIGVTLAGTPDLGGQAAEPGAATRAAPTAAATPTAAPRAPRSAAGIAPTARPAATSAPTATARPTVAPPPTPPPRFTLAADGPRGCPLAPLAGRVVMTQGYGEGSHAPTDAWGAVDLAIDGDGDGYAEPGATWGAPVLSALPGAARVFMGSWPGGNFVRVVDERSGWSVAYGHLDTVAVADGQIVEAGAAIGTVGSTGMASGPHLHYEVWRGTENVDPTGLIGCW